MAFRVPDNAALTAWTDRIGHLRVASSGEVRRYCFRSLYFHEPGGNLFELATDGPGFDIDEPCATMGRGLSLPPFLEDHRTRIEAGDEAAGLTAPKGAAKTAAPLQSEKDPS